MATGELVGELDRRNALPADEWAVRSSNIKMREKVVNWFIPTFCGAVVATFGIIVLEGFGWGGFDLPDAYLKWLGMATVGEIAGLLYGAFRYIFSRKLLD